LRWFAEFERAGVGALNEANRLSLPIYAFAGGDDTVIRPESVERFVDAAASSEKTYRLWHGLRHETLNERKPERDAVTNAVIDWISARCSIK
jgi:acylglycerol lipase